ncbi:MAG: low affinity iron permease family protein [Acidobacteriia bacterium]|nr:low affinity iron permease family protein [Terriglobia bacterium]
MRIWFRKAALWTAEAVGSPWAFLAGVFVTLTWALSGPYFHYSDTWQLVINTGTTIATFLIVFLIQHTQNRDARVMQLKLDELIRAVGSARTELVQMESLSDEELTALHEEFQKLQEHAAMGLKKIEESRKKRPVQIK